MCVCVCEGDGGRTEEKGKPGIPSSHIRLTIYVLNGSDQTLVT